MNILCRIPSVLACDVLCRWISIPDLARTNSAFCARNVRKDFLAWIDLEEFVVMMNDETLAICYDWVFNRNIKMANFHICAEGNTEQAEEYLNHQGRYIYSVEVKQNSDEKTIPQTEMIINKCPNVINLKMFCYNTDTSSEFRLLKNFSSGLVTLHYTMMDVIDLDLLQGLHLPHLKTLYLEGSDQNHDSVTVAITNSGSDLYELYLYGGSALTADWFVSVVKRSPRLQKCGSNLLDDATLSTIAQLCPHIVQLCPGSAVTDTGVLSAARLLNLQCLSLPYSSRITHRTVQHLIDHCADSFEKLSIGCRASGSNRVLPDFISETDVHTLRQTCKHFRQFHWSTTLPRAENVGTSNGLQFYAMSTHLCIIAVLTDTLLTNIAAHCTQLRHLDIMLTVNWFRPVYTSTGLRALINKCPNLQSIHMPIARSEWKARFGDIHSDYPYLFSRVSKNST